MNKAMYRFVFNIIFLFILNPFTLFCQPDYWIHTNGPHAGTIHDYSFGENNIVYAAADNGVYKSTDNGENWSSIGFLGTQIWGICKTSSGSLLAGTINDGLYRTTNEGLTWTFVLYIGNYIYDIKEINSNLIILASYVGVYKSTNNGANWEPSLIINFATSIDTSSNNEIFVSTFSSGIYKSTNNGDTWISLSNTNFGQTYSVNVAINGYIFITTYNGSIYRSTNNGLNFEDLSINTPIYKPYMSVTTKDGYLYCGEFYQGIWTSSDFGNTWTKQFLGERYNFFVRKLCEGPNGSVFASVAYNGVIRTTDHGEHWYGYRFRESYTEVKYLLKTSDGKILSSTSQTSNDNGLNWVYSDYDFLPTAFAINVQNGFIYATDGSAMDFPVEGIYRSTNNGEDWEFIKINNFSYDASVYVSRNGDIYARASNGIFKSTNNGTDWIQISNIGYYNYAANDLNYIYGKKNGGLFRSTSNGQSWENVLPLSDINGAVYPAVNGDLYSGGNGTLFKSTNNGDNWTQENITGPVSSIIENQSGRIFASIYGAGIFYKEGDSWTNINHNLGDVNVNALCFNSAGQLLAGTTTGVYRTNASVIGISNFNQINPFQINLCQNYPNPFNPVTYLEFGISNMQFVSLKVYDVLGNEVVVLVNEKKEPGNYKVEFDGSSLASGIYYYKITSGSFTETKKMMLLK